MGKFCSQVHVKTVYYTSSPVGGSVCALWKKGSVFSDTGPRRDQKKKVITEMADYVQPSHSMAIFFQPVWADPSAAYIPNQALMTAEKTR